MKKKLILILAILVASSTIIARKYKMVTGFNGGTYYKIGQSMASLPGLNLTVKNSKGSLQNIKMVRKGYADFGITQLDIFENLSYFDSSLKDAVKILFLLHKEEVHVLARKEYKSFKDLKGKKVAFGNRNSGTFSTSQILVISMQMNENQFKLDYSSPLDSLKKLANGSLDAMIVVSGAPVDLLTNISSSDADKMHFLSFNNKTMQFLTEGYLPYKKASLTSSLYPNLVDSFVSTVSTRSAVIVKANMPNAAVRNMILSVFKNRAKLVSIHPKWKEIKVKYTRAYYRRNKKSFHKNIVRSFRALRKK